MVPALLVMCGLGAVLGIVLSLASKIFYVYEDPRIAQVEDCLAGANCGGCGFAGCSAAAVAVVEGQAPANVCIVAGDEATQAVAAIMGMAGGLAEASSCSNPCTGGDRAKVRYLYEGIPSCRAQMMLDDGKRQCDVGCLGYGDCVKACLFDALKIGPDGFPVVDEEKCVGCGACERICPKNILTVKTPSERLLHFNTQEDALAPCRQICPAQINIPLYIAQIREGDYEGAVHTIRERNPLLLSCGRVCPHPCEDYCRRGEEDEPVSINQLKRFAADYEMNSGRRFPISVAPDTGKKIAVIGGGPAGLSCAFFLRRMGHNVTIFEAMPKMGGMIRYGIPEYRLPKKTLDWEIEGILNLGIESHTQVKFGVDFDLTSLVAAGYDAIFMGIGAWKDSLLRVEGENLEGCYTGIDFLSRLAGGEQLPMGETAVVIGGGNTAIDCTRNLLRYGAKKVYLAYRRTRKEMPANPVEIEAAEEEGVEFIFLTAPKEVISDELKTTRWNTVDADPNTLQSNIPYLFAGGDSATGPALVVTAIGGGRRAARSIHQYVMGEEVKAGSREHMGKGLTLDSQFDHVPGIVKKPRSPMEELPADERIQSFVEVDQVLTEEQALTESERCLSCCITCYTMDPESEEALKQQAAVG